MRIAIVSDIHGNAVAFDAVLADLRTAGVDQSVCLGDAVQGGPQPAEVVARLRGLGAPVVMGNADAWLLTGQTTGGEAPSDAQRDVRAWSLSRLSAADRAYMESFRPTIEIPLEAGLRLLCFHGSPRSFDDLIFPETPEDEFQRLLGPFGPALMCGGHTHLQQVRRLGDGFFFNPGSVGAVYNRNQSEPRLDPWAEYALLTVEAGRLGLEFRRVPIDVDAVIAALRSSGRPHAEAVVAQYGRSGPTPMHT